LRQNKFVINYVAFALCILTNLGVEQVFQVSAYKPDIMETFKSLRI